MIQAPPPFTELAPGLWVTQRPLRFFSLQLGTRMTVIRLTNGGLWLHSPVALDPLTLAGLQSLGPVEAVVCPNRLHHLFVADYFKVFPKAKIYAAPGLETKRRELKFHDILSQVPEPEWKGEIDQVVLYELPIAHEVVFFHHQTRSLILTDLCFNIGAHSNFWTRLVFKLLGSYQHFGPTPDIRWIVERKPDLQKHLLRVSEWDFDRILLPHGDIVESGGKRIWNEAWKRTLNLP